MLNKNKGFTLIELMIVVAIIGTLAAIAIPIYNGYVIRSQLVAAYAEVNKARSWYEVIITNGARPADFTLANMDLPVSSHFCLFTVHAPVGGVALPALECELQNVASVVNGESIFLNRQAEGDWQCTTSVGVVDKYKPRNCV